MIVDYLHFSNQSLGLLLFDFDTFLKFQNLPKI